MAAVHTSLATVRAFLSFAAPDGKVANDLWDNLRAALDTSGQYRWKLWAFTEQLVLGDDFDARIKAALLDADLGIFALSNRFLASDYIRTVELPPFLASTTGKRVVPVALKDLPTTADLRGLQSRQIFSYQHPYDAGRAPYAREQWANLLADELHRVAQRYGLGH